jgi:hypothetical protein
VSASDDLPDVAGNDPAAELRRLYARLAPPPLADDLDAADAETAHVVGWMRAAYRGLAVPAAEPPRIAARTTPRRRLRPAPLAALAAAAAVLALGGAALWRALAGGAAPAVEPGPAPRVARGTAEERGIEIRALAPDQVELRSGPVRLVLLAPPASESDS